MNTPISLPLIWPVTCHTDYIGKNSTFVAIKGQKQDGAGYIQLALQKGARIIVAENTADINAETVQAIQNCDAQLHFVPNARRSLALLSANAWGNPASQLKIIAVTGTKGKTTTAWLLRHIMQNAGHQTALLSTVKNKIGEQEFATELTTQQPDYLHAFFYACVKAKIEYVVMEVAAQALSLHRVAGIAFDGAIFTNFAPAHGEFYATVDEYFTAKRAVFDQCKPQAPLVINADDQKGASLLETYNGSTAFSLNRPFAQIYATLQTIDVGGIAGVINGMHGSIEFECPLVGDFNAYNILAASSMAFCLGISPSLIQNALATFAGVPGRLERYVLANGAVCFIDYAHNPFSFKAVLGLLRSMTDHLIVVAGAGGDRDGSMRPELGKLMAQYADRTILTTDNPRTEDPADIIAALYAGIDADRKHTVVCELDREVAIKKAYAASRAQTIIALLGKGPEQYQIIGGTKFPFSERTIVQNLSNR